MARSPPQTLPPFSQTRKNTGCCGFTGKVLVLGFEVPGRAGKFLGDCAELASENLSCGLLFGGLVGPAETPRRAGPGCIRRGLTPVPYAISRRQSERWGGHEVPHVLVPYPTSKSGKSGILATTCAVPPPPRRLLACQRG
jgi:hypothetical protein